MIEELANEIKKHNNKWQIIKEIEWLLNNHYTKCRFLALLMTYNIYKPEHDKLSEELTNRELLLKLYNLILK
jgi:hypothetical protein